MAGMIFDRVTRHHPRAGAPAVNGRASDVSDGESGRRPFAPVTGDRLASQVA